MTANTIQMIFGITEFLTDRLVLGLVQALERTLFVYWRCIRVVQNNGRVVQARKTIVNATCPLLMNLPF